MNLPGVVDLSVVVDAMVAVAFVPMRVYIKKDSNQLSFHDPPKNKSSV